MSFVDILKNLHLSLWIRRSSTPPVWMLLQDLDFCSFHRGDKTHVSTHIHIGRKENSNS